MESFLDITFIGDLGPHNYVYADGSFGLDLDESKTLIGIGFYENPDNPEERLAVGVNNLGEHRWGLYPSGLTDLELSGYSEDLYDLSNLATINSNSYYIDWENDLLDSSAPDGFKKFSSEIGSNYFKDTISTERFPHKIVGFCTTIEDVEDNQSNPSQYAVQKNGKWVVPEGSRVPWGFIQTLYIINHRNEILTHLNPSPLEVPTATESKSEWDHLRELMSDIKSQKGEYWDELYFPAASLCHSYSPNTATEYKIELKEGEVLNPKFAPHNWFLPSIGDLARLNYLTSVVGYGFGKAFPTNCFERFNSLNSYFWSSNETRDIYRDCANALEISLSLHYITGATKSSARGVRPIVAY